MRLLIGSFLAISVLFLGCHEEQDGTNVGNTPSDLNPKPDVAAVKPTRVRRGANHANETAHRPLEEPSETAPVPTVIHEENAAGNAAGPFHAKTKDEYVAKFSDAMKRLDKKFEELRAKGEMLKGPARQKWRDRMMTLQLKRQQAHQLLIEMKATSKGEWADFRETTTDAWEGFKTSLDAALKEFAPPEANEKETPANKKSSPAKEKPSNKSNAAPKKAEVV